MGDEDSVRRETTRQDGVSLWKALLGYLVSLLFVGPATYSLAAGFGSLTTRGTFVMLGLLVAWSIVYILFIRWLSRNSNATEIVPVLAAQRSTARRGDTAQSILMVLLWPTVGFFGLLFISIIVFSITSLFPGAPEYLPKAIIAICAVILLNGYMYFIVRRVMYKPTGKFVLWLRRFHRHGTFPFNLLLEEVSRGIALPVTVQDTTVASSEIASRNRGLYFVGQTLIAFVLAGFMASMVIVDNVLPVLLLIAVIALAILWLMKKGGNSDLRTRSGQRRVRKLLRLMDSDQKIPQALTIVRMSDQNWKDWVGEFIQRADAVIVDVTHITPSIGWELQTCSQHLAPVQMILACGHSEGSSDDPWPDICVKLDQILGKEYVAGCQRFNYTFPGKESWFSRETQYGRTRRIRRLRMDYEHDFLDKLGMAFLAKPSTTSADSEAKFWGQKFRGQSQVPE